MFWRSALDLAAAIRSKQVSPVEIAEAILARIEALNPRLNAFCLITPEVALRDAREAEIAVRGGAVRSVRATTLTSRDVHDHNTFDAPRAVVPAEADVAVSGAVLVHRFPAASVTKLEIALGG